MPLPRFVDIDGRRYLWRDLVALRQAQAQPRPNSRPCLSCAKITARPASATPPSATASRACSPSLSGAAEPLPFVALLTLHEAVKRRRVVVRRLLFGHPPPELPFEPRNVQPGKIAPEAGHLRFGQAGVGSGYV